MNTQRTIVLFLGPPGAGKGSLSQLCVKRLGWQQLSTGNLCREHITSQTEIGKKIDFAIKSGKLLSDEMMVAMVDGWLAESMQSQTVIFDGFPRTVAQAESLQKLLEARSGNISLHLIRLVIPDEELVRRLLARSICQNKICQRVYSVRHGSNHAPTFENQCDDCNSPLMRRSDDEEIAIKERLKIYHDHEMGLCSFYEDTGYLVNTVEAHVPIEEVYARMLATTGILPA